MRNSARLPRTSKEITFTLLDNDVDVNYNDDEVVQMWYLTWEHGFMGLSYCKDDEEKARQHAAVFVHLWKLGIDCSDADHLAAYWANNREVETL